LIYFPSGEYKISNSINMYIFTQLVGNPLNRPTIRAAAGFNDLYLINAFPSPPVSPFPTTINLYLQVRNFIFDTTAVDVHSPVACVNWPSAQAVTFSFNHLQLAKNSMHQGIVFNGTTGGGGGSATYMGDISISGGDVGIRLNNQQYAIRAITFDNVKTGIFIEHIFTLSLQGLKFHDCDVGVNFTAVGTASVGSLILLDSEAASTKNVIISQHPKSADGSIVIENLKLKNVSHTVADRDGKSILAGSEHSSKIESFIQGNVYKDLTNGTYMQTSGKLSRSKILTDRSGAYLTKSRPQYEGYSSRCFSSVRDFGATGDGKTDVTHAVNAALKANANKRITYFPAGNYRVAGTIEVPAGSRLVGEAWSTLSGMFPNPLNSMLC
jgi:glucan 1,3-beta-glucosidase